MTKILIVDDEQKIRELVKKYAVFEGYEADEASDGIEAVNILKQEEYDIVIMDIMMPELDGFTATKEIRKFSSVPIILLSARGEEYDKIHGFENGADDYVVKPFSPRELMLRVNAVLARVKRPQNQEAHDVFEEEGLKIDFTARLVYVNGNRAGLSPKEYDLLFYMVRNKNIALSREKLITEVWGYDFFGDDRTLDTHIKLLRKNLEEYGKFIVTVRGVGYRFETK